MKSHRKKNYLLENFAPWRIKKTILFSNKFKKKKKKTPKDPYYPKSKILLTNLNFRNKIRNIMKRGNSKSSKANYYLTGPDPNNLNILILRYFGDPFFFLEIHSFKVPTYVYIIQNLPKKKAKKYVKTLAAVPQ